MNAARLGRNIKNGSTVQGLCRNPVKSIPLPSAEETQPEPPPVEDIDLEGDTADSQETDEDSEDDEVDFRAHCKSMFKAHGVPTIQSYFDIEKKKFQSKSLEPPTKKRKIIKS